MQATESRATVIKMLKFLKEAAYIDRRTATLDVSLVTFASRERIFGSWGVRLLRSADGTFSGSAAIRQANELAYDTTTHTGTQRLRTDVAALAASLLLALWAVFDVWRLLLINARKGVRFAVPLLGRPSGNFPRDPLPAEHVVIHSPMRRGPTAFSCLCNSLRRFAHFKWYRTRMQRYQKSESLGTIILNVAVLICQINAALVFFEGLGAVDALPPSLRAAYNIYNAVDTAPARPLLPFKRYSDALLVDTDYNLTGVDLLPCGTGGVGAAGTVAPVLAPRWALETNNAGFDEFFENQVRAIPLDDYPPKQLWCSLFKMYGLPMRRQQGHGQSGCRCAWCG